MQTPTTAEFNTTIKVLKKYAERLNEQAAHSMIQMSESRLDVDYAARIQSQTIGQIGQIETVAAQVKKWRDEIIQQSDQSNFRHV
jgi:uncharacterized protein YaaN involved in tellurite resistance